jgi:hypothetical protein
MVEKVINFSHECSLSFFYFISLVLFYFLIIILNDFLLGVIFPLSPFHFKNNRDSGFDPQLIVN